MHFAAVAYVGESTLEPLRYVIYASISYRQNIDWILSAWLNFLLQPGQYCVLKNSCVVLLH